MIKGDNDCPLVVSLRCKPEEDKKCMACVAVRGGEMVCD